MHPSRAIPAPPPPAAPLAAHAYCRAARRLRGRYADRPARLHRELLTLSRRGAAPAAPAAAAGPCEAFAAEVGRRMEGPVLRYAQRRALFGVARRSGIGRFEANLIIAAVQHRRCAARDVVDVAAEAPGAWPFAPLAVVAAVQGFITWGVWRVFAG